VVNVSDPTVPSPVAELTETERALLEFEKQRWHNSGAKETAIRDLFGLTATAYYQRLNLLIDRPEAYAAEPVLVKRLLRLRETRRGRRRPA
jgi:hypothetical protein